VPFDFGTGDERASGLNFGGCRAQNNLLFPAAYHAQTELAVSAPSNFRCGVSKGPPKEILKGNTRFQPVADRGACVCSVVVSVVVVYSSGWCLAMCWCRGRMVGVGSVGRRCVVGFLVLCGVGVVVVWCKICS